MADQYSNVGTSSSNAPGESFVSTVVLNIKTLDSQKHTFEVEQNMLVSLFKEKIASKIGVPVGQQRLIFRGKVLRDEHPLSEYHVENGHTIHLVERQPTQSHPSPGTGSGGTSENNGNDASTDAVRNRVGQISHSVVLGTFNVGEQGEGVVPDLTRVIGTVLNSIGVGGQNTTNATSGSQASTVPVPNTHSQSSQGNETGGTRGQNHVGYQPQPGQGSPQLFQSFRQVFPVPLVPTIPSVNAPIPDSLTTLSEFMNCMEQALSQNGYQPQSTPINTGDRPRAELPSNAWGMATPEALAIVLRHAERLLNSQAITALSHIAGCLEQGASLDPTARGQIQTESVRVGLAMQHFGALLLEIGRTILTLRMGQSPAESVVNAGPAVYISPSGPNPIMVQPFPLQTSSLFGGSAPPNRMPFGPVATGNPPRHVNIHIHAGTGVAPIVSAAGARTNNGEGMQAGRSSTVGSGDSGATRVLPMRNVIATAVPLRPTRVLPMRNVIATAVPLRPTGTLTTNAANPGFAVPIPQPSSHPDSSSPLVAEINSRCMDIINNMQGQSQTTVQSSSGCIPKGQKKRGKQDKSLVKGGDGGTASTSDQTQQSRISAQQVLQSLASRSSAMNQIDANDPSSRQAHVVDGRPLAGQGSNGQLDMAMSQVLNSPALNGLLGGVSEQTGVGSPDVLRNMLQQFTQSPQMMNTVSQIAQQVDNQDLENMLGGMGRGQGGGMDLSRMIQQMMPIVSGVLGGGTTSRSLFPAEPQPQNNHGSVEFNDQNIQINLEDIIQTIENQNPPEGIFRAIVHSAVGSSGNEIGRDLLDDLRSDEEDLASEYMEMLRRDLSQHRAASEQD